MKKKNTCTDDILIVSYILCKNDTFFVDPSNETDLRSVITCLNFLQHTFFLQLHRFLLTVCSSAKTLASIQFEEKKKTYTLNSTMNETLITHMIVSALLILWHLLFLFILNKSFILIQTLQLWFYSSI